MGERTGTFGRGMYICRYGVDDGKTDCGEAAHKTTQEQGKPKRKCSKDAVLDCSVGQRQDS